EKVMLDLKVQPADERICEEEVAHIARRLDLHGEEVGSLYLVDERHALVVRREDEADVEAVQAVLDRREDGDLPPAHSGRNYERGVEHDVQCDQAKFDITI